MRTHAELPGFFRYLIIPAAITALMLPGYKANSATLHQGQDSENITFVLIGDPFGDIIPPEAPRSAAPRPATPPAPAAPAPAPNESEASFEERMEAFEEKMEAYAESMTDFEADMEAFGEVMEAWGEEMGEYGEKMGAVGEALGEAAEDCQNHQEESAEPALITARIEDSRDYVKVVCVRGDSARYMDDDVASFVRNHPDLTVDEKDSFFENRDDPSRSNMN